MTKKVRVQCRWCAWQAEMPDDNVIQSCPNCGYVTRELPPLLKKEDFLHAFRTKVRDGILTAMQAHGDENGKVSVEDAVTLSTGVLTEALGDLSWKLHQVMKAFLTGNSQQTDPDPVKEVQEAVKETEPEYMENHARRMGWDS